MQPVDFIAKWKKSKLKERAAAQEHFIDLCKMLRHETPAEADPDDQILENLFAPNQQLAKVGV